MLKVIAKLLSFWKKEKDVESTLISSEKAEVVSETTKETVVEVKPTPVVIEKTKEELEKIVSERLSEIKTDKTVPVKKEAPKKEAPKKEAPKKEAPKKGNKKGKN